MLLLYKKEGETFVTKTSNYLIPMIRVNLKVFMRLGLVEAYLGNALREYEFPTMHLLFKPIYDEEFAQFCADVRHHPNFVDDYDISEEEVMFVFAIPDEFLEDVEKFKQGKFSEISSAYIKKYYNNFRDPRYKVFNKDAYLRKEIEDRLGRALPEDAELESLPLPEVEIYNNKEGLKGWD